MIVPEALVGPEAIKSDAFSCIKNQINFAVPHRVYNSFIMRNIIKMVYFAPEGAPKGADF